MLPLDALHTFTRLRDYGRARRRPRPARSAPRAARHVEREWRVGAVLMVPNGFWHFHHAISDDHPGVYLGTFAGEAIFLKGTDAGRVAGDRRFTTVAPTVRNGLLKPTAFRLAEIRLPLRKAELLFPERWMGALTADELLQLQEEVAYAARDAAPSLGV